MTVKSLTLATDVRSQNVNGTNVFKQKWCDYKDSLLFWPFCGFQKIYIFIQWI